MWSRMEPAWLETAYSFHLYVFCDILLPDSTYTVGNLHARYMCNFQILRLLNTWISAIVPREEIIDQNFTFLFVQKSSWTVAKSHGFLYCLSLTHSPLPRQTLTRLQRWVLEGPKTSTKLIHLKHILHSQPLRILQCCVKATNASANKRQALGNPPCTPHSSHN